ncbi:proteasome assembly chaperone 4 [Striga asiatica]|uniref:Proteasome assembly chaperone 4 n=1 Tax=Striga asiatica TaxID=4170 RepID=A0A5A7P7T4_STRAF|nr:proteasome assembly chaperone 4 [Striga asiatica]
MDSNEIEIVRGSINELSIKEQADQAEGCPQITCFSQASDEVTFHFQIIRLHNQIYAWVGCNTAKFGHLYAAAPTRPSHTVGVTSLIRGASDNTGSGIARRLVLKTGLNIVLACNIPKNNPMLEANAEKMLMQKLISLGYTKSRS